MPPDNPQECKNAYPPERFSIGGIGGGKLRMSIQHRNEVKHGRNNQIQRVASKDAFRGA